MKARATATISLTGDEIDVQSVVQTLRSVVSSARGVGLTVECDITTVTVPRKRKEGKADE